MISLTAGVACAMICAQSPDAGAELAVSDEPQETVVTATRGARPAVQVPFTVTVVPRSELERSPSQQLDALVRIVPSVGVFRRSTSLVADPTSQGLNLRGVGPSGVSRALVLLDGAPVNDPFGGWVFWRSVPRLGLERVEIAPGPGSGLYGSSAMGGVVNLVSRAPRPRELEAEALFGSFGTLELAARGAHSWGTAGAVAEASYLRSDGYEVVLPPQAGMVDRSASSESVNVSGRFVLNPTSTSDVSVRLSYFDQHQNGGTALTDSAVWLFSSNLSARVRWEGGAQLTASANFRAGAFQQRRARISSDRSEEALAASQEVPLSELGAAVLFEAPTWARQQLSAGLDVRRAVGASNERIYPAGQPSLERASGGQQQFGGVFVQDVASLPFGVELVGSVRADLWRNLAGKRDARAADGTLTSTNFPERFDWQLSPRLGALWRPVNALAFRVSGGTGFRAPTLNELYRPFQVGTVLTQANESLVAERIVGGEGGVEVTPLKGVSARATYFWNWLENPVTNVTLPNGMGRQRMNLGVARVQGVEATIEARLFRQWVAVVGYSWMDARVIGGELSGKRLAQAPQHRGSLSLSFDKPEWVTATVQVRAIGAQFEDDQNTLPMDAYAVVDLAVSRRLFFGFEVFAAIENLLNQRYLVGRAGIDTWGQPLTFRAGLRLR